MAVSIAVVDDDEVILDAIKMLFESLHWDVQTYATGEAFLADSNNHKLDCVVLDPHLPGMTGADVARAITTGNGHIPIIALTARPSSPITLEVLSVGARVLLTKPVTAEELIEQVQAAIQICT